MGSKFHVNPTTGNVGRCTATKRACSYGDDENHFTSEAAARSHFEETNKSLDHETLKKVIEITGGESEVAGKFEELSNGTVSLEEGAWKLKIEGVESYHQLSFSAEHDLNLYLVKPLEGEPFSIVDYGIHRVVYDENRNTQCVLDVPEEKRKPYRHYHSADTFWHYASENDKYDDSKADELVALLEELDSTLE